MILGKMTLIPENSLMIRHRTFRHINILLSNAKSWLKRRVVFIRIYSDFKIMNFDLINLTPVSRNIINP